MTSTSVPAGAEYGSRLCFADDERIAGLPCSSLVEIEQDTGVVCIFPLAK